MVDFFFSVNQSVGDWDGGGGNWQKTTILNLDRIKSTLFLKIQIVE